MNEVLYSGGSRAEALQPPPPVARKFSISSSVSNEEVPDPSHFELDDFEQPSSQIYDEHLAPPEPLYTRARSSSPSGVSRRRPHAQDLPYINTPTVATTSSSNVSTAFTAHSPRSYDTPPSELSTAGSSINEIKEPHAARSTRDPTQYHVPHSAPLHKNRTQEDYHTMVEFERGPRSARSVSTSGLYRPSKLRNVSGHTAGHCSHANTATTTGSGPGGLPTHEELLERLKCNHQLPRSKETPESGLDDLIELLPPIRRPRGRTHDGRIRETSKSHRHQSTAPEDPPHHHYQVYAGPSISSQVQMAQKLGMQDARYYDHHCEEHGGPSGDCREMMHHCEAAVQDLRYRENGDFSGLSGDYRTPTQDEFPLQDMSYGQYRQRAEHSGAGHKR